MNDYLISYKIATVAELIQGFNSGGYNFSSYTNEWWNCDAWVASKIISANNAGEARYKFITELIPEVEKFSVVSQCAFRLAANSYFIFKKTHNPENIIYIYYVKGVSHTGLHFDTQEIEQLPKFQSIPNKNGLFYIMEAANSMTAITRLTMLLGAAEGFAGEIRANGRVRTDQNALKAILGNELYDKLYLYGTGLRHKLIHGNIQNQQLYNGLAEAVYIKITEYLKNNFDIQLEQNVVNPQRNFYGNFLSAGAFEKVKDESLLDLKMVEDAFDDDNPKKHEIEAAIFDGYVESPQNY
ncbi:hypothetical protein M1563_00850 [Patescibacteria group bacterium]|nr:hypothetical protein [Patescibacteria group bacterium]